MYHYEWNIVFSIRVCAEALGKPSIYAFSLNLLSAGDVTILILLPSTGELEI